MVARASAVLVIVALLAMAIFASPLQLKELRNHYAISEDLDEYGDAVVSVLGFDDSGHISTPISYQEALNKVETNKPRVVFFFVHGWKNDGSISNYSNGDLNDFKAFIKEFSEKARANATLSAYEQYKIHGIYLAWHGHSRNYLKDLTFWNRNHISKIMGQSTSLSEVVKTITKIAKANTESSRIPVRVIAAGHSMGGKIVNTLINEQIGTRDLLEKSDHYPDLWLIINPAESHKHIETIIKDQKVRGEEGIRECPKPKVVFASSQTDDAIKRWYRYATGEVGIGHGEIITHETIPVAIKEIPEQPSDCSTPPEDSMLFNLICNEKKNQNLIKISHNHYYRIQEKSTAKSLPGYWIISLPPEILDGHDKFFTSNFQAFTAALYRLAKPGISACLGTDK